MLIVQSGSRSIIPAILLDGCNVPLSRFWKMESGDYFTPLKRNFKQPFPAEVSTILYLAVFPI
jgi:hypothetical protein